tara:strand:- start:785 stop:1309 length:525 start_codon:yes stop_codon:yes gene_type:complete
MTQPYPAKNAALIDDKALRDLEWVQALISSLRNIRGEMNIDPQRRLPVLLQGGDPSDRDRTATFSSLLIELGRLDSIQFTNGDAVPESATALVGSLTVLVPLGAVIDRNAELARLTREITRLRKDLQRAEDKLANRSFVDKAPAEIVAREEERAAFMTRSIAKLEAQQKRVERL